ncbi:inositol monophosphatase family protein [Halobacterium sp. KA-6]|uniref:inositol monophosphatase family protein n=1 Tax=Halobacterium sp. KA-6 TaxID=2896368 RepID=UPI001E61EDC7|nr:inositol monophosphatase [Halobacterium sp. KA-6]MCD2204648.1 inositol monophosphatase [Halobacterium sp. KA-6]
MLSTVENTAVRACLAGGRHLRERFGREVDAEFSRHDVKAAADRASEQRMLDVIRGTHPDHAVYAEESGDVATEGDYRWVVDPLDGTNNFVSGLPSFATAAAVLDDDGPVVGCVYVPVSDDLYVARRGEGARHDGDPVSADGDVPTAKATIAFVIGHDVKRDNRMDEAASMQAALGDVTKRVVDSWSPCVHWGALARGRIDGMVCFHPDDEEQHVGELLASEAGASTAEPGDGVYVAATTPAIREDLVDAVR